MRDRQSRLAQIDQLIQRENARQSRPIGSPELQRERERTLERLTRLLGYGGSQDAIDETMAQLEQLEMAIMTPLPPSIKPAPLQR